MFEYEKEQSLLTCFLLMKYRTEFPLAPFTDPLESWGGTNTPPTTLPQHTELYTARGVEEEGSNTYTGGGERGLHQHSM